jgi:DNA replication initiation complex subunit (GINS family)
MCVGGGGQKPNKETALYEQAAQMERENQRNAQMRQQQEKQDAMFAEQMAIRNAPPPEPPAPVAETAGSAAEGQESSTPALIKKGVGRKKLRTDMTVRGGLNIPTG